MPPRIGLVEMLREWVRLAPRLKFLRDWRLLILKRFIGRLHVVEKIEDYDDCYLEQENHSSL